MALSSLRRARPMLCQAVISSQAGPSRLLPLTQFSTTSSRRNDDTDPWAAALKDVSQATTTPTEGENANGFRSSVMPGFRSSLSSNPQIQRSNASTRKPFNLHVQSTRNNTILCLTDSEGSPITRVSSGMLGFKHAARSGYEAGHQSAIRMFSIIQENKTKWRVADLNVVFKGFGIGRDAVHRALLTDEGTPIRNLVRQVKDASKIKVGGCRPKKIRMH